MAATLLEELVVDVLERLPTKSLMRFKSVKQSWNALFKTITFVKRHSQRLKESASDEQFLIMHILDGLYIFEPYNGPSTTKITLLSSDQKNLLKLPATEFPSSHNSKTFFSSFFHCNGVICLNYFNKYCQGVVLLNPATKEVKLVPPSTLEQVTYAYPPTVFKHGFGFGANPNTSHDFKIIQFFTVFPQDNVDIDIIPHVFAEVYNTRTNSWTVLHDLNVNYFIHPTNYHWFGSYAFGNGVFHWLSCDYSFILCFNFQSNQFRKLNTPTTLPGSIIEVGDSIAYVVKETFLGDWEENLFETVFEIWILKQDSCWTKICKLGPFHPSVIVRGIWNDATEFLIELFHENLVSYNSEGQEMQQFQMSPPNYRLEMHKYVESIAPLSL